MATNQEKIEKLTKARQKAKFADSDWEKRGLNPSDSRTVGDMIRLTDACLDELLADLKSGAPEKQVKATLAKGLKRFKTDDYDTEEKEFIGDEFYEIGQLLDLDIADILEEWMYGKALAEAIALSKKKEEVIIDTKSFECAGCKKTLLVKIKAVRDGAPSYWFIGQCNQCREYNLLSSGENTSGFSIENFSIIKNFYGDNNTEEYAKTTLEDLRKSKGSK